MYFSLRYLFVECIYVLLMTFQLRYIFSRLNYVQKLRYHIVILKTVAKK